MPAPNGSRRRGAVTLALLIALVTAGALAHGALGQRNPDALRHQVQRQRGLERQLASSAARLGRLERQTSRAIAVLSQRLANSQSDLQRWQAHLADTQARLRAAQERLVRLRARLAQARRLLAAVLRRRYMSTPPDVISVVLEAHGFADMLERLDFLRRVEHSDTEIVGAVRAGRADARRDQIALTALEGRQREQTAAVRQERDALASMNAALQARQATLARVRAAKLAALQDTRASRVRAEHELSRLLAEQAAANRSAGPGGPWAIPWPIVQCESGGQNLPPNTATASGYYQMLDTTWRGLGGSTPHAYQASKSEQDRLAARLWAGGSGASNWVCAALIGMG